VSAKPKWFKDGPGGQQLHVAMVRGQRVWHSDDGGAEWWGGIHISHDMHFTREELRELALGILRGLAGEQQIDESPLVALPPCDICGKPQPALGGLRFGPPRRVYDEAGARLDGLWCRKTHVCVKCQE